MKKYYQSPFFFDAFALKETNLLTIELTEVFRQKDEDFLEILGEDYFTDLGLKKSEISGFIFHVMSGLDLKNAYKYGYLKGSDIAQFRKQAETKINDFRKLK
mgnify:CR=1 FL=1